MTTIAYRDGALCGDTGCFNSECWVGEITKVGRLNTGHLYGWCGDLADGAVVAEWIEAGSDPDNRPEVAEAFSALVVDPNGTVYLLETNRLRFMPLRAPYYAIGCGAPVALGALYAGADAETAVHAAIRHDISTAGHVTVVRLAPF